MTYIDSDSHINNPEIHQTIRIIGLYMWTFGELTKQEIANEEAGR